MAETTILNGNLRTNTGKGFARASRRAGRIPAIIYGDKQDTISIDIEEREYKKIMTQSGIFSRLLDLNVDGKSNIVLTRDIQFHPVSENPLHVDFLRIGKGSTITVSIPVSFINEELSPGLKTGGVLNTVRFELELECPADNIPEKIEINLEGLVVGDSIKISTVELPDGVKPTITDRDFTIATIAPPTVMKVEEEKPATEEESSADSEEAKTEIVGIRPGEKLHEQMIGLEDAPYTYEYPEYFKILPSIHGWHNDEERIGSGIKVDSDFTYRSDRNLKWMRISELQRWIEQNKNKIVVSAYHVKSYVDAGRQRSFKSFAGIGLRA